EREPVLQVEVRGPSETVTKFLRDQPEITVVNPTAVEPDLTSFEIKTKDRKDLREPLAAKLVGKGWGVRRLNLRKPSLEGQYTAVVLRAAETQPQPAPAA